MLLAAASPAAALSGRVVEKNGAAVAGAAVCYVVGAGFGRCATTDGDGRFELGDSQLDTLSIRAEDFIERRLPAIERAEPIVIERGASLMVRLLDAATGEPLDEGRVEFLYSSGRRHGMLPVNRNGLLVRGLEPGSIRVIGHADGYRKSAPGAGELVKGQRTTLDLRLQPADSDSAD